MNRTSIEWTTFSANPLKYRDAEGRVVWACVHTSPGCQNCYSEALATRYGRGGPFQVPVMNGLTPYLDDAELHKMRTAKTINGKAVTGSRCFLGDMTDLFGEWVPDDLLNQLFSNVLEIRTDVTWQLLTKRAERMQRYLSWRWGEGRIPSRHIHVGVSVENQHFADERIPLLLQTPAAVRFVSAEPLLGPVNLSSMAILGRVGCCLDRGLDWIIVGGESGPHARPLEAAWVREIVQQCQRADVPVFVKQLGAHVITRNDDGWEGDSPRSWPMDTRYDEDLTGYRDGYQGAPVRVRLRDRKGGDMEEWPNDLRVRQFPEGRP